MFEYYFNYHFVSIRYVVTEMKGFVIMAKIAFEAPHLKRSPLKNEEQCDNHDDNALTKFGSPKHKHS